jgi:hypothetical protein
MRRLVGVLVTLGVIGGLAVGARAWIAQDKGRCALVPDYLQAVLCKPEVIQSMAYKRGSFPNPLDVRFMSVVSGDGHPIEMVQLLKPFSYRDSKGQVWDVPEGFLSDGASIPEQLWAVVGGPYSGPYRDAAVIHDYYCYTKQRKWEEVHDVFLEAALNRGTPEWKAQYMFAGILLKGPRWPTPRSSEIYGRFSHAQFIPSARAQTPPPAPKAAPSAAGKTDAQIFEELRIWIEKEKPTRDQIRQRIEELRKTQTPVKK